MELANNASEYNVSTHQFNRSYLLKDEINHTNFIYDFNYLNEKIEQCAFCIRNGSPFTNHPLKDSEGGTVCPVLSQFTCKLCAATGREAHTHKYCKNNPYTHGDPIAVGMAPGPSRRNPRKPSTKLDSSIDLNDIYGIRKSTTTSTPKSQCLTDYYIYKLNRENSFHKNFVKKYENIEVSTIYQLRKRIKRYNGPKRLKN